MVNLVLKVFNVLGRFLPLVGVDREQFMAILRIKLTLDERRPISGVQTQHAGKANKSFLLTLFIFAIFGLLFGVLLFLVDSPLTAMTFVFTFTMTMVSLTLLADFTNVLLDTTDNAVILPRPVDGRTLFAARVAHIISYLGLLALSLSLCSLVAGIFAYNVLFPLLYLLMLSCALVLVVFGVYVFFFVTMRLVDMERFRDIILYIQIFMTVAIFGGYQLFPRMMDMRNLRDLAIDDRWWIYIFPPAWMAAPFDLLMGHAGRPQLILTLLAFLVPAVCLVFVIRVLAPDFNTALARMEADSSGDGKRRSRRKGGFMLVRRLAKLVARRAEERASFELIWQIASRDRPYKLATYPMVAFVLIVAGVFLFTEAEGVGETLEKLPMTQKHLFPLYFICAMSPMTILHLRYSNQHEAAWIYYALPLESPGSVLAAGLKVLFMRFMIPMYGVIALATLLIWGPRVLPDIAMAFLVLTFFTLFYALTFARRFPFSEGRTGQQSSALAMRVFLFMFVVVGLGFLHFGLTFLPFGVPIGLLVMLLLNILLFERYRKTSWWAMKKALLHD